MLLVEKVSVPTAPAARSTVGVELLLALQWLDGYRTDTGSTFRRHCMYCTSKRESNLTVSGFLMLLVFVSRQRAYVTYHNYFQGQPLTQVTCSDGANGLITHWGYSTIDPMAP